MAPHKPRTMTDNTFADHLAQERADTIRTLISLMDDAQRSGFAFEELVSDGKQRFERYVKGQLEFDPRCSRYEAREEITESLVSLMVDARRSNFEFEEILSDAARRFLLLRLADDLAEKYVIDEEEEEIDQRF